MAYVETYCCDYCGSIMMTRTARDAESIGSRWVIKLSSKRAADSPKSGCEEEKEDPIPQDLLFCDLDCCGMWFSLKRCNVTESQ